MAPKIVVITGCSSGIGLETAVHLAKDKENRFKVYATMRNLTKKDQLETAAGSTLYKTLFIRELDVTKENSIVEFIDKINQEEGRVDVLVNNAGIAHLGVVETVPMDQIRAVYETNVFGLIRLTQAVIPGMKSRRSGHIINVSSAAGLVGMPFNAIYASSKFAVEGFSESIAPLLKKFSISVSVIEPGPVRTSIVDNMALNKTGSFRFEDLDPGVDELTKQYFKSKFTNAEFKNDWSQCISAEKTQAGTEIANIIQDVIISEEPHLHYPTSDAMRGLAAMKYTDPSGDSIVQNIAEQQQWKE
ncbi:retinol dehydrogenase 8-like [Amphiura filiformis]|uniref:retinol dehydrogenase 8-like n=1 Tax=Amphiura filiformis TaxID=82378 RepID=UPI003B21D804